MASNTCTYIPQVNGKDSRLYQDLMTKRKLERPTANLIYATYVATNLPDIMDQMGFKDKRDNLGQHKWMDVLKAIDFDKWESEIKDIDAMERAADFMDSNGNRIQYTSFSEALDKADKFNDSHDGLVAKVVKIGDKYNIIAQEKTSRTYYEAIKVKESLKIQEFIKSAFRAKGMDIDALPADAKALFESWDTLAAYELANYIQPMSFDNLYYKEALLLLGLSQNQPLVQRMISSGMYNSIEEAAQAIADHNAGITTLPSYNEHKLRDAIDNAKKFNGLDLQALSNQVNQMSQNIIANSKEEDIKTILEMLNKQYGIDKNEIERLNSKIRTLSEATAEAAVQLQRRIRILEKEKGNNAEGKKLEKILDTLLKELNAKRYASGIMSFLNDASAQITEIDNMLLNTSTKPTEFERAFENAKILQDVKKLRNQYYFLLEALSRENLIIDESINQADIDNIRRTADALKKIYDKNNDKVNTLTELSMVDLLQGIVGKSFPDGMSVVDAVRMAATDSSMMDYLYSMSRVSNPVIAAMGSIVSAAQRERVEYLRGIGLRIRRETHKLYKSGSNSKYMYDINGRIISDIDWDAFYKARKEQRKLFWRSGLRGFDLKQALEGWEDQNTEERVVDTTNGRTERVPDARYRLNNGLVWDSSNNKMIFTAASNLTAQQEEYYNNMMQIKGEIGSLLPAYAQDHYYPPQIRRSFLDAIGSAKHPRDILKALKNKFKDMWVIREDDTNFASNGIVAGEEFQTAEGDFDNTPLNQIPIFFLNKIKDQSELLKDFSSAIQHLASTAINYNLMRNVMDVVEFMGDFVEAQSPAASRNRTEVVENESIRILKKLFKWGKGNGVSSSLVEGFMQQHFYGQTLDPDQIGYKYSKLILSLIGYTSFKGLATNIKGAFSNYVVGEYQMMIEAGAGEFYNFKNFTKAHLRLFGGAGVGGEIMELLTNNKNHKATLFREMFDPIQENFSDMGRQRYYYNMFRQLISHDCSFIGYASGEYLIHYVNMYAVLDNIKVRLNGKRISLYDAFEVANKQDGNSELVLKNGVTDENGNPITKEFLDNVKDRIKTVNQNTHGAMNPEDKGLIHQQLAGRATMNFRQWMIEHYSRRYRENHFDGILGQDREGYWRSIWKGLANDDTKYAWKEGRKKDAMWMFMKDFMTFMFRAQTNWKNLDDTQKYNIKRVRTEMLMYISLIGLSFVLGEPDKHKKEWWRRWWIYQTKRLILDSEASLPNLNMIRSGLTILQSPMAGVDTFNSLLYVVSGWRDIGKTIQSGPHKGENRYIRNVKKYALPFFKDYEQMMRLDEDASIFTVFDNSPGRR